MRDVFEQMYGNKDMLVASIMLLSIGSAAVVDFIDGFVLVTITGNVTIVTRVPLELVTFDTTVVTLTGTAVVIGGEIVVVVGGLYEAITKAPMSCVTPGLVKL